MTDIELSKMASMIADSLAERLKDDDELLERVFPSRLMSLEDAAKYTGLSESTIKHKIDEIPHSKIGKRLVFTERGLAKWIKNNGVSAARTAPLRIVMGL